MKTNLTSRLQVFLAKIAGRKVSESTLTPPVVSNVEEVLFNEIAERIDTIEGATQTSKGNIRVEKIFVDEKTIQANVTGFGGGGAYIGNKSVGEIVGNGKVIGTHLIAKIVPGDDSAPYFDTNVTVENSVSDVDFLTTPEAFPTLKAFGYVGTCDSSAQVRTVRVEFYLIIVD